MNIIIRDKRVGVVRIGIGNHVGHQDGSKTGKLPDNFIAGISHIKHSVRSHRPTGSSQYIIVAVPCRLTDPDRSARLINLIDVLIHIWGGSEYQRATPRFSHQQLTGD